LVDGYRTRLTGLTTDEAETLFLAGAPGAAAELGLGSVLAAAELKVLAAMPPELRSRAGRIRQRFHLDAPGWFHNGEDLPFLSEVADAVWRQRVIQIRYQRWHGEVDRIVHPLGLVLKAGVWYLVGAVGDQIRTYRISRIEDLTLLDQTFDRPEDFDLPRYWADWATQFQTRLYATAVTLRLSADGQVLLPYLFPQPTTRDSARHASPPDDAGWIETVLYFESIDRAVSALSQLGANAEVLAPLELRQRLAATAIAMARLYDASGASAEVAYAPSFRGGAEE
jgi:predicted DNA-binding transcriptional regulator YafY